MISEAYKRAEYNAAFDPDAIMLDDVQISSYREDDFKRIENIYGQGTHSLDMDEVPNAGSFLHPMELLRGRVPGVRIVGGLGQGGTQWNIQMRGPGSINGGQEPLILVDNMPVPIDVLNSIPPSTIDRVEIYMGGEAVIFGAQGANGVISFFTKVGFDPPNVYAAENTTYVRVQGYQEYQEFYSPDYSTYRPENAKPDNRATILWEPLITLESGKSKQISFFTTDEVAPMTVIVEGMTKDGRMLTERLKIN